MSLNVHADVGVGMKEGWQILGVYSQLEFAVPIRDDVCMCGKCESLFGKSFNSRLKSFLASGESQYVVVVVVCFCWMSFLSNWDNEAVAGSD